MNTGKKNLNIHKIKANEEFGEIKGNQSVIKLMLHQMTSLCKNYPRSILILSILQFGIYFVCNGMLLFFPHILNETAVYMQTSGNASESVKLCDIVEDAIKAQREEQRDASRKCIEDLDISSYYYAMLLEVCYVLGFLLISWMVNYVGRLSIFSFIFFTTSLCGFAINFTSPLIGTYLYVWLLAVGINNTLLNTVTYDLFPTNLRSLAMSISLMFGRLGSLIGVNIAGSLLENHCGATFTISGGVLLLSGVLTFVIPNIMKRK